MIFIVIHQWCLLFWITLEKIDARNIIMVYILESTVGWWLVMDARIEYSVSVTVVLTDPDGILRLDDMPIIMLTMLSLVHWSKYIGCRSLVHPFDFWHPTLVLVCSSINTCSVVVVCIVYMYYYSRIGGGTVSSALYLSRVTALSFTPEVLLWCAAYTVFVLTSLLSSFAFYRVQRRDGPLLALIFTFFSSYFPLLS